MANHYLKFITDEHLISCIRNLHSAYLRAKSSVNKRKLYKNKIDTIKLTFDAKFNGLDEGTLINSEITRQIDKSINNAIGTFHEEIVIGFKSGQREVSIKIGEAKLTVKCMPIIGYLLFQEIAFTAFCLVVKMLCMNYMKSYQKQLMIL